ncbi:MAG: hypothetical protein OXC69_03005 [Candidatus Tectomicrobia bacterium]|nr:hypothetical protein [Candidatus Tectomicrobia bacterium]
MPEANPSAPPVHDAAVTEFDLREGILLLALWWREILGLTLLVAILGTAWQVVTLEYEAAADVVVLRARTGVVFDDERFTTLPEQGRQPAAELLAGRDTLFGLASSGAVALAVSERLNENANGIPWEPAGLLRSVDAELVGTRGARNTRGQTSAMVRITARAGSPSDAALIANAWAEAYVNLVNTLYAPNSARQLASITEELVQAQQAYNAAQDELEAFVSTNEARRVEQEVAARVAVLEGYFESEIEGLNEYRATRRRIRRLSSAVQSLREQVEMAGVTALASNRLAIQLLKVETYVTAAKLTPSEAPLPAGDSPDLLLDFDGSGDLREDASSQRADLEALDKALQSWLAGLDSAIDRQTANLLSTGFYSAFPVTQSGESSLVAAGDGGVPEVRGIETYYEDIRSLEARLEALVREEAQLTSQRDRLFTALDVLRNREAEFRLAAVVSQPELRLASQAVQPPPLPAIGAHLLSPAAISAVVGLTVGVALAFLGNLLGWGVPAPNRTEEEEPGHRSLN